ncbi:hypothetical protein QTL97_08150 [Sporosarcina thermotolerans]|uniref:Uncharacterized protein n=1 Tax=Sporosarcina thermotolerans TaxID=633404 RepID=A0AAW9A6V5_9BACL|nr:hypothetical protein [Sporosarcina thermotolerans]MDW0116902.1 hypothetical protein [Sporosarcina thermotolerans]
MMHIIVLFYWNETKMGIDCLSRVVICHFHKFIGHLPGVIGHYRKDIGHLLRVIGHFTRNIVVS